MGRRARQRDGAGPSEAEAQRKRPRAAAPASPLAEREARKLGGFGLLVPDSPDHHRCGYVAIVGRPNAGKSTFLNAIVGQRLSSVTHKPQTTRHRIVGLVSTEDYQLMLLDTPGVMQDTLTKLDEAMIRNVRAALLEADVALAILDASVDPQRDYEGLLPGGSTVLGVPVGVIVNKTDLVSARALERTVRWLEEQEGVDAVFPSSAAEGEGLEAVLGWASEQVPRGPALYPREFVSEHPERFFVAELIRERVFIQFSQEVPYCVQVTVADHVERSRRHNGKDYIKAELAVERESQKGILLGRAGAAIKELSTASRKQVEAFLGRPVHLELKVKVRPGWRKDEQALRQLGLDDASLL